MPQGNKEVMRYEANPTDSLFNHWSFSLGFFTSSKTAKYAPNHTIWLRNGLCRSRTTSPDIPDKCGYLRGALYQSKRGMLHRPVGRIDGIPLLTWPNRGVKFSQRLSSRVFRLAKSWSYLLLTLLPPSSSSLPLLPRPPFCSFKNKSALG